MNRRLSVCYAAPGHKLVSTSGSARNILSTAEALSEFANVTLAFREVTESPRSQNYTIAEIAPGNKISINHLDDVSARGLNPFSHLSYLRTLQAFAAKSSKSFDLVFEKGWRLSGYLSTAFIAHGVNAVLIENAVHRWNEPIRNPRTLARYLFHVAANYVASSRSRRLPLIIAETEQLKSALAQYRGIALDRIEVVGLGVDHSRFFPISHQDARAQLGVREDAFVLVYVGGMDQYHDLTPILEASCLDRYDDLQVHLVGDGEYRQRYEQYARRSGATVIFHGRIPHNRVPTYIALADICLAPYDTSGFHDGEVGFSTLKIPEYMACARPVISVPSGHILSLIKDRETGFMFPNKIPEWQRFLAQLPSRQHLATMGRAAADSVSGLSWSATAQKYLELSSRLIQS